MLQKTIKMLEKPLKCYSTLRTETIQITQSTQDYSNSREAMQIYKKAMKIIVI